MLYLAVLMFAILLGIGIPALSLGLFFGFVGIVMLTMAHLTRRYLILAASDKRVFVRSGWFYADMVELRNIAHSPVSLSDRIGYWLGQPITWIPRYRDCLFAVARN